MIPKGSGASLLTGATASIKGFAQSAGFAMGKSALRGLAQSVAPELGPKGIHVAHFIIDGGVRSAHRLDPADNPDCTLDPDAIARPTSTCGASLGAPGPWRSSCALGSSASEHVPSPSMKNGRV
jgi:NAD(P)-dependent dehydrogenase (short-subunit alcohol dehydrogenase family)